MDQIVVDRRLALRSAILSILLLWPLLIFGRPSYLSDSASYQKGGRVAVTFALAKLHLAASENLMPQRDISAPGEKTSLSERSGVSADGARAKAARSITYSAIAYILRGPGQSMIYLAAFQAVSLAFIVIVLFEGIAGRRGWRSFAAMALGFAFLTTAAPVTTGIVPDVFAGIIIGVQLLLTLYWRRISWLIVIILISLSAFGVSSHASHPPLALGMAVIGSLWLFWFRQTNLLQAWRSILVVWMPALFGTLLVSVSGLVGFGEFSIAPKRHPLALARSIDNGPARWYLQEHCKRPEYAVCEIFGTSIPRNVEEFLWLPGGVVQRATPEQMDRIRAEESTIVWRATLAYPGAQLANIVHDIPSQLISFDIQAQQYFATIVTDVDGKPALNRGEIEFERPILQWLNIAMTIAVLIATVFLALRLRRMTMQERGLVALLFAALLINASVCALFSGVASRYQARVIMILPLVALAVAMSRREVQIKPA